MVYFPELCNISHPLVALVVALVVSFIFYFVGVTKKRNDTAGKNIPPGSLGPPIVGESWSFMKAYWEDRGREWIVTRVATYGPVFKTSIICTPTIVVTGRMGNKFGFSATDDILSMEYPAHIERIFGKHSIFKLTGERYKLVKGAIMDFLKPECLQQYVGQMDTLVKYQLVAETNNNDTIMTVSFMKRIAFNLTCSVIFGIHDEPTREALLEEFNKILKGFASIPLIVPGTTYYRALQARAKIEKRLLPILRSRRMKLHKGTISAKHDLISRLLSLIEGNKEILGEEVIVDNFVTLTIASHDTSAALLSLMVWKLGSDPEIYKKVLEEQKSILNQSTDGTQGELTWSQIQKMKYTWRVAQELLRQFPPVFGSFRKAVKHLRFGGYDIPKGWQVFFEASGTHMDIDIFKDPTDFKPSRFENPSKPIPSFAYIPFGSGPRMCIGNEFARVETLVIIHNLVTKFEWFQLCPDEKITRKPFPYPAKGLPIKLRAKGIQSSTNI